MCIDAPSIDKGQINFHLYPHGRNLALIGPTGQSVRVALTKRGGEWLMRNGEISAFLCDKKQNREKLSIL